MACRIFVRVPGYYPLDTRGTALPIVAIMTISRHCQCLLGARLCAKLFLVENYCSNRMSVLEMQSLFTRICVWVFLFLNVSKLYYLRVNSSKKTIFSICCLGVFKFYNLVTKWTSLFLWLPKQFSLAADIMILTQDLKKKKRNNKKRKIHTVTMRSLFWG